MPSNALLRDILAARPFAPPLALATLAQARVLQAGAGTQPGLLCGRRIGLMCASDDSEAALLFRRAASTLGAQVSHLLPVLDQESSKLSVDATAQLLGRLYDAVECQGMEPALVRRLGLAATIPIYPGLACADHPSSALARELPGDAALADKRAWVLQALLLKSID